MTSGRGTKIVVMTKHFLYLPLYYAHYRNYFGFLPATHHIDKIVQSRDQTDLSAFEMLMDTTSEENRDIDFAVADPTCILDHPRGAGPAPIVLAELISNTAFWAIDRRSRAMQLVKEIGQFDNIISFHPGTTSYGIASRIYRDAGRPDALKRSIRKVDPGKELIALKKSEKNTIALSPDILGIDDLVSTNTDFNIDFIFANSPEYTSVLITGLLSRTDVVDEKHALIVGLLKALHQSIKLIRQRMPDVIDFANSTFESSGIENVMRTLNRIDEAHIFPASVEVDQVHWINAARVAGDAKGTPWNDASHATAMNTYDKAIQPYCHLAKSAVSEIESRLARALELAPVTASLVSRLRAPIFCSIVAILAANLLHWSAPWVFLLIFAWGTTASHLFGFVPRSKVWFLHWVVLLAFYCVFAGFVTYGWDKGIAIGILVALALMEMTFIYNESQKR
jgi:hypothetical protein